MSGETEQNVSGWTVDTLFKWVVDTMALRAKLSDQRFTAMESMIKSEMMSAKEAVVKAENAANDRFKSLNELRGAMSDQSTRFMPRETMEALITGLTSRLDLIKERQDRMEGRGSGLHQGWGYIVGAIGVAAALFSIMRHGLN